MKRRRTIEVETKGRGLYDVTSRIAEIVARSGVVDGLCHVFVRHTSASLVIQENADPAVLRDLQRFISRNAKRTHLQLCLSMKLTQLLLTERRVTVR